MSIHDFLQNKESSIVKKQQKDEINQKLKISPVNFDLDQEDENYNNQDEIQILNEGTTVKKEFNKKEKTFKIEMIPASKNDIMRDNQELGAIDTKEGITTTNEDL